MVKYQKLFDRWKVHALLLPNWDFASLSNSIAIYAYTGPFTGWDTWEFFPGPTAPGGPMGAHSKGNFFFNFKERKKLKLLDQEDDLKAHLDTRWSFNGT